MEDPDEHTSLVKRVKQVQREGEESKQQWWAFCELEGKSNRRDPQRHSLQSLRRFFQIREQGGLPRSVQKLRSDAAAHQLWVQKLTEILRASEEAKQNWWDYCDKYHGGSSIQQSPSRHSSSATQLMACLEQKQPRRTLPMMQQRWPHCHRKLHASR
ncbi:Polyubiquitin [Durusdinium trenchii]|uniref:Polyubiquitin n=1 Tax=Durusdinium trenchii TaxID=1381693 RepID=A0ABP0IN74_9DINO